MGVTGQPRLGGWCAPAGDQAPTVSATGLLGGTLRPPWPGGRGLPVAGTSHRQGPLTPELSEVAHLLLDGWAAPAFLPPAARAEDKAPAKGRDLEFSFQPQSPAQGLPSPSPALCSAKFPAGESGEALKPPKPCGLLEHPECSPTEHPVCSALVLSAWRSMSVNGVLRR